MLKLQLSKIWRIVFFLLVHFFLWIFLEMLIIVIWLVWPVWSGVEKLVIILDTVTLSPTIFEWWIVEMWTYVEEKGLQFWYLRRFIIPFSIWHCFHIFFELLNWKLNLSELVMDIRFHLKYNFTLHFFEFIYFLWQIYQYLFDSRLILLKFSIIMPDQLLLQSLNLFRIVGLF